MVHLWNFPFNHYFSFVLKQLRRSRVPIIGYSGPEAIRLQHALEFLYDTAHDRSMTIGSCVG
jgi:hypothetical protein